MIWGGNPVNTQVNVMSHAMEAKRRGAPLVVVDPYRTGTAAKADLHLAARPGTDGALACAIMHVLFAEGFADWDYLRALHRLPGRAGRPRGRPARPEWAAAITGLSVDEIVELRARSTAGPSGASSAATTASAARATARPTCTR